MSTVLYAVAGAVATITLARPDSRNALNLAMCDELAAAAVSAGADPRVRVVVVRAQGPVFCAGADLKERKTMTPDEVRVRRLKAFGAYEALERLAMPSIAVIEGAAVGAGCEIAAACDVIVATPQATFRTPEALLGTIGATQRLPRVVGPRLAKDLMFTGRTLTADEALRAGLVCRLVQPDALENELASMVQAIATAPADSIAAAKHCIDRGVELDRRGALATELLAIERMLSAG